jgi:hypothetical protein
MSDPKALEIPCDTCGVLLVRTGNLYEHPPTDCRRARRVPAASSVPPKEPQCEHGVTKLAVCSECSPELASALRAAAPREQDFEKLVEEFGRVCSENSVYSDDAARSALMSAIDDLRADKSRLQINLEYHASETSRLKSSLSEALKERDEARGLADFWKFADAQTEISSLKSQLSDAREVIEAARKISDDGPAASLLKQAIATYDSRSTPVSEDTPT